MEELLVSPGQARQGGAGGQPEEIVASGVALCRVGLWQETLVLEVLDARHVRKDAAYLAEKMGVQIAHIGPENLASITAVRAVLLRRISCGTTRPFPWLAGHLFFAARSTWAT